jgi:hypothetical protein
MVFLPGSAIAHAPECGRLVASGLTIGYGPNNFDYLADNFVDYTWSTSHFASKQFALFQDHDPWGDTVVKTAITDAGYSYDVFTPGDLAGFAFSGYKVVVLNWDDADLPNFEAEYEAAIPRLQTYMRNGGVVWLQASYQTSGDNSILVPFGGTLDWQLSASDHISDTASPLVDGAPNPLLGNEASHAHFADLPTGAQVVTRQTNASGPPSLYTFKSCLSGYFKPDGRIRKGTQLYVGNDVYNSTASGQTRSGGATPGHTFTFGILIQNDGIFADSIKVHATGAGNANFVITYWKGTTNVTAAVVAGTYKTASLGPGGFTTLTARVTVKTTATSGAQVTRLVTLSSVSEPARVDAVKFIAKRL